MKTMPDYSKLDLRGNGHTQDSFSLAVQAAVGLLGREADYETIFSLSGNCFAPAIDRGEDCTAWWHVKGWQGDKAMQTVAKELGLHAERLVTPPDGLSAQDSKEEFERKALIARKNCAAVVRKRLEEGSVVITDGGWQIRTPEGFAPWCWWGIVTKASDDGDMRGACLLAEPGRAMGSRDRPLDYLGGCWAISLGTPASGPDGVGMTVLTQAVARIRGTGAYAANGQFVYGLEAMDAWIAQMGKVPFCPSCAHAGPNGMAGCAINNVQTTSAGAGSASSYLRRIAPGQPEAARPHLAAAAQHYDRIVELLKPATWEFYAAMLNDAAQQSAHADNVLTPVKNELAAAADEMERAVGAMGESAEK